MTLRPALEFGGKVQKGGNSPLECEDHFAISMDESVFALADGATDAAYSNIWAEILVRCFCRNESTSLDPSTFETWLEGCRQQWLEWEKSLLSKELPWFTREKLRLGSWATFLGISFEVNAAWNNHILWRAVAFGDSCLFMVQHDYLAVSFPLENVDDFDTTPPLLGTFPQPIEEHLRIRSGSISPGDKIYLMTDALARWFLDSCDKEGQPWERLDAIEDDSQLDAFVYELRENGRMRNDDVTLIRITCELPRPTDG